MTRNHIRLFLVVVMLLFAHAAVPAQGTMQPFQNAGKAYTAASNVVIAVALSVDDEHEPSAAVFEVRKVFKGQIPVGARLTVIVSSSSFSIANCSYSASDVGLEFPLYLTGDSAAGNDLYISGPRPAGDEPWPTSSVLRSPCRDRIGGDLMYLAKVQKIAGQTRISGKLSEFVYETASDGSSNAAWKGVSGRTVTITGGGRKRQVTTDTGGFYEAYGFAPGSYRVETKDVPGYTSDRGQGSGVVRLSEGAHAEQDFYYRIDNRVAGRVVDPAGKPLAGIDLSLKPVDEAFAKIYEGRAQTGDDGSFRFERAPSAEYIIVANPGRKGDPDDPYPQSFYPMGTMRENAAQFYVGPGSRLDGLVVHAPAPVEFIKVWGRLVDDKGEPLSGLTLHFRDNNGDYTDWAGAGADGRFMFRLRKGSRGTIMASRFVYVEECSDCSPPDDLQPNERYGISVQAPAVPIETDADRTGIEMILPAPSCRLFPLSKSITTTISCGFARPPLKLSDLRAKPPQ
jgi:hypothetical protein